MLSRLSIAQLSLSTSYKACSSGFILNIRTPILYSASFHPSSHFFALATFGMLRTLVFAISAFPWLRQAVSAANIPLSPTLRIPLARRNEVSEVEHIIVDLQHAQNSLYEEELKILRGYSLSERNSGSILSQSAPSKLGSIKGVSTGGLMIDRLQSMWYGNVTLGTPPKVFSGEYPYAVIFATIC
jgi:hypothetical protein